jgi:isopentenyl-diphosphate delta-isomerase
VPRTEHNDCERCQSCRRYPKKRISSKRWDPFCYDVIMQELWQLYDDQGRPITGKGATKDEVFGKGLLHAASHVWIWRKRQDHVEILVQKRAADKRTWPNRYDISAAGHIDLSEDPLTAALRETQEEIGLDVAPDQLQCIGVYRAHLEATQGAIENEFQWLYILELTRDAPFDLQQKEVASLEWKTARALKQEVATDPDLYVPHGKVYFDTILQAIETASQ